MALFGKKDPQKLFEGHDFTVTKTLFNPPRLTFLPGVYMDEPARRWAVKHPNAEPSFFSFDDVVDCQIVEDDGTKELQELEGAKLAERVLINPAEVSRANAAKRDQCLGMAVVVAVRTPDDEVATLQLPVVTKPVSRKTGMYQRVLEYAEALKHEFDAMRAS